LNLSSFFAELKRRNVYKVAAAYAVVAWLLIQIATQVFPFFEIPNWTVRLVVLLIMIGFPIALIIAWAFELTPQGLQRTETLDEKGVPHSKNRVWIFVVFIAGAMSVGLFFLGRYTAIGNRSPASSASKSIAVLPFDNLSRDPDNAFFAEGIQDEILARLAKIADLKVISRTSTQHYKSSPGNLPEIAKQLGVSNLLEGSVQKANDRVRVTVQLINAADDAHLWAETYDRNLTDIFAVESEIAKTIADTLRAKLTGSEQHAIAIRPTENTEAYQLYLKGRYFWNKRTADDFTTAIDYFNQAIAADPNYALAYAGLADAYVLLSGFTGATPHEAFPKARAAAQKALALDNTLGEAHASLALELASYEFDFPRSVTEFKRAIELNPNYATAHQWYGNTVLAAAFGRFDEAIQEMKQALELDPLSLIIIADLGNTYFMARRYEEAIDELRKTIKMDPGFYYAYWNLGQVLEAKGDLAGAITQYKKAHQLNGDPFPLGLLGHAYALSGNRPEALKILGRLTEISGHRYVPAYTLALVHLGLGNKDEAVRELQKSYDERAGFDLLWIHHDPMLEPLRGDPRFEALVQKIFGPK